MAEYMLMVLEDERAHTAEPPKAMAKLIEERAAFAGELRRAGVLKDSGQLRPSKEGKRVRRSGKDLDVRDGPFIEKGRALGAYYWVEAPSVDEAAKLAIGLPALPSDEGDVRPLMRGTARADKDTKPGKVIAFAVLGNAESEEAWVKVMDRIDAETRSAFPTAAALGGLRLQPPKTGKRVATRGDRRAMFDGPFLESKEVIGGVFFLRMASLAEAVAWAAESRFVAHGALEIRELWRT